MTRDESRVVLALIDATSTQIDTALEDGLCCPECGSRNFVTLQREETWQRISEGGEWGQHKHVPDSTVTVGLACDDCDRQLWGETVKIESLIEL